MKKGFPVDLFGYFYMALHIAKNNQRIGLGLDYFEDDEEDGVLPVYSSSLDFEELAN